MRYQTEYFERFDGGSARIAEDDAVNLGGGCDEADGFVDALEKLIAKARFPSIEPRTGLFDVALRESADGDGTGQRGSGVWGLRFFSSA